METPASFHRHPIHTILVAIPIGLWVFSFACDIGVLVTEVEEAANLWYTIAYYAMLGGFAGALLAMVPGFIDYRSLADPAIRRIATMHMAINVTVVALYAVNLWIRAGESSGFGVAMGLSALALVLLAASGWLGAEMVHVHRVGIVEPDAQRPFSTPSAAPRGYHHVSRQRHCPPNFAASSTERN